MNRYSGNLATYRKSSRSLLRLLAAFSLLLCLILFTCPTGFELKMFPGLPMRFILVPPPSGLIAAPVFPFRIPNPAAAAAAAAKAAWGPPNAAAAAAAARSEPGAFEKRWAVAPNIPRLLRFGGGGVSDPPAGAPRMDENVSWIISNRLS